MKLQFQEKPIFCLEQIKGQEQTQEQTQELRLPEGMPDVGRVLCAWGQLVIRGKQWQVDSIGITAGVKTWVLYAPEDGSQAQCVESWIPVSAKWELPDCDRDGRVLCSGLIRSVDARSLSGRKLMLRATVSLYARAYVPYSCNTYLPEDLPPDIQLLQRTQCACIAAETGEKAFCVEDALTLPASAPEVEKLICYNLQPEVREQKVLGDKVIFRGVLWTHILYRSKEGTLNSWDMELPFSQYEELEKNHSQHAQTQVELMVTALELSCADGGLALKADLTGQYVIYDEVQIALVEDGYSPDRELAIQKQSIRLPVVLQRQSQRLRAEQTGSFGSSRVVEAVFYPGFGQKQRRPEEVLLEVPGNFQTLYYDLEGSLQAAVTPWQQSLSVAVPEGAAVDVVCSPEGKTQAIPGEAATVLRAQVLLETVLTDVLQLETVAAITAEEPAQKDPDRPSVILRKAGKQRLWDIAKKTGSTVDAIMKANDLQAEPDPDTLLLIPIP